MPAPAPAAENGAPKSELQELQLKATQVTDESLDSTRRMLALCEENNWIELRMEWIKLTQTCAKPKKTLQEWKNVAASVCFRVKRVHLSKKTRVHGKVMMMVRL
uniref:Uncharacterized protein n=1 Tax=Photinus pyralis TaxID=7054 RepID=A0A1Y1JWB0_PHOPY